MWDAIVTWGSLTFPAPNTFLQVSCLEYSVLITKKRKWLTHKTDTEGGVVIHPAGHGGVFEIGWWKEVGSLDWQAREYLEILCVVTDSSGQGSEAQNADRNVKVMLMRYQMQVRILMRIELKVTTARAWQRNCITSMSWYFVGSKLKGYCCRKCVKEVNPSGYIMRVIDGCSSFLQQASGAKASQVVRLGKSSTWPEKEQRKCLLGTWEAEKDPLDKEISKGERIICANQQHSGSESLEAAQEFLKRRDNVSPEVWMCKIIPWDPSLFIPLNSPYDPHFVHNRMHLTKSVLYNLNSELAGVWATEIFFPCVLVVSEA